MASPDRSQTDALERLKEIAAEPYKFGFYEALRWFDAAHPDRPRTGYAARPRDEAIRIGQQPTMSFPPAPLASFGPDGDQARWRLTTYFFGLFGANGILPLHLTEFAYERVYRHRDKAFTSFVDLFHHRFAELFYRAWADAQPTVQYDRPDDDRFAKYVGSLAGYGDASLRNRDSLPDNVKLHFTGHLACQTRHPDGLRSIVAGFFGVRAEIAEFVGRWLKLPPNSQLRLGADPAVGRLGDSALLGDRVWDRQQSFRIELGPLRWDEYQRMLPGGESLKRLRSVVLNYVGFSLHWDVRLTLKKEEVPGVRLGGQGRLGWSTWVISRTPPKDRSDLVLDGDILDAEPVAQAASHASTATRAAAAPVRSDTFW